MNAAATADNPVPNRGLIVLSIMVATVMQVLDTTIANVALPHMQGSLSATQDQISWVLTSYIVASAIMTPPTAWLAARFGRTKIFCLSIVCFTVASGLCGLATSLPEMVFFRLLQGVGGAALVPLSQSVMLDITPKEKHGAAMALWGIGVMVGPILGPTLGGFLTEYYNWRWCFYINLPLGILACLGVAAYLPEGERHQRPFDTFGFVALSLFIAALQLMLDRGQEKDWFSSGEIIAYTLIAAGGMWMFLVHMFSAEHPFISRDLFGDRNFVTSLVFIFFVGIILLATMALLPPYMQNLMGYSVVEIGTLLAPRGVGTMISMMIVGRISGKVDPRWLIFLGLCLTAYSLYEMAHFATFVPQDLIIRSGVTQGLGLGFIFVPLNTIAFATLRANLRTEGAGLYSLTRNLGSSIGVSVVMALFSINSQINHSYIGEAITAQRFAQPDYAMPQGYGAAGSVAAQLVNNVVSQQAMTIAYLDDFKLMMIVVMLAMPLVLLLKTPKTHAPSQPLGRAAADGRRIANRRR
ncbi:MAG: DHA2 family efflux MFS transporter permease subunit [Alphaproteobacteria bacterium]